MKYQLTVKDITVQEFLTRIVASKDFKKLDIISVFNLGNNVIDITILINSNSIDLESFEKQLSEAVFSPDSDIIDWKKLD